MDARHAASARLDLAHVLTRSNFEVKCRRYLLDRSSGPVV